MDFQNLFRVTCDLHGVHKSKMKIIAHPYLELDVDEETTETMNYIHVHTEGL